MFQSSGISGEGVRCESLQQTQWEATRGTKLGRNRKQEGQTGNTHWACLHSSLGAQLWSSHWVHTRNPMCSQLTGKASVTRSNVAMLQPCEGKDSATLGTHSLEFLHFGKMSIFIYYDIKTWQKINSVYFSVTNQWFSGYHCRPEGYLLSLRSLGPEHVVNATKQSFHQHSHDLGFFRTVHLRTLCFKQASYPGRSWAQLEDALLREGQMASQCSLSAVFSYFPFL